MANKLATCKCTNGYWENTAASEGDGHQALALYLDFETVPIGCGWWWALETVSFASGLDLVQLFLVFYSTELHFSHPCAMRTISCLASDKVVYNRFFRHNFLVTVRVEVF